MTKDKRPKVQHIQELDLKTIYTSFYEQITKLPITDILTKQKPQKYYNVGDSKFKFLLLSSFVDYCRISVENLPRFNQHSIPKHLAKSSQKPLLSILVVL